VRKAATDRAIHACVLNAKGRIDADVYLVADAESFIADAEPRTGEALAARFDRYIIADDVHVEEVADRFALFHVLGPDVPALAGSRAVRAERFGLEGADLWLPRADHAAALRELSTQLSFCDEECTEVFRVERGIPRAGCELTEEIIPTEANLEATAIDYAKGCYIGQEVISRIKMSGQTNKRLCGLLAAGESTSLAPGMRLLGESDAKDVGWITSVATSARLGRTIALGFVKRGSQAVGTRLRAGGANAGSVADAAEVEIVALPFV
jgi:folate-binding protein YgfZ